MHIVLAGTGTPVPLLSRAGTSIHVSNDRDEFLIDCGPGTVHRLIESGINPANIENILFTHHHMDHNADFFQFAISSWIMGRESLTVYGPEGTPELCESLKSGFKYDLRARRTVHRRPLEGLDDIRHFTVSPSDRIDLPEWEIDVMSVEHVDGLETVAYRVEEPTTEKAMVYSSDTTSLPEMSAFASGVDVLVHEATIAPYAGDVPSNEFKWDMFAPESRELRSHLAEIHSTPEEAAEIAQAADVDTLVLTHILPYRDTEEMREKARRAFDGEVVIAVDGLDLEVG